MYHEERTDLRGNVRSMVLDVFRFEMSLAQTNGGKRVPRNGSLASEEGMGPEMRICRKHQTEDGFESKRADEVSKESTRKEKQSKD